ncbi:MAG TPA: LytTR family DNA-binding domain-containing protein [Bacteroidales bacterium]|nr:LytTR family DNA-binding domain-containing protein [Bacteroidales bacterium]
MIRTILIDDEPAFRHVLADMIRHYTPDLEVVAQAGSVKEAAEAIHLLKPQLLFLDVHLTDGTGFDLLQRIGYRDLRVIFTTAHDSYAITAFRFNAIDYILKPVDLHQFLEAVEKVRNQPLLSADKSERYFITPGNANVVRKKLALPTHEGINIINTESIIRCESDGSYTTFVLAGGQKITVSRSMKEYDEMLTPSGFFRVHQSHLVNLNQIRQFLKEDGGTLIMTDGSRIEVSRRRKDLLLQLLQSLT